MKVSDGKNKPIRKQSAASMCRKGRRQHIPTRSGISVRIMMEGRKCLMCFYNMHSFNQSMQRQGRGELQRPRFMLIPLSLTQMFECKTLKSKLCLYAMCFKAKCCLAGE